jgi:hypothetical protein
MKTEEPFLFRFKKSAHSPSRVKSIENEEYDGDLDMTMVVTNGTRQAAIDANYRVGTKKNDMEKGEDQKDSLMWH